MHLSHFVCLPLFLSHSLSLGLLLSEKLTLLSPGL